MALGAPLLAALAVLAVSAAAPEDSAVTLSINTKKPAALVSERFLSVTLDPQQLREQQRHGRLGVVRALAMARGLSPAYVRVAGPSSDSLRFVRGERQQHDNGTVTESDILALAEWAQEVGGVELILCLNALVRVDDAAWDSRNAMDLMAFADSMGYPLSWQFGYEAGGLERAGVGAPRLGADLARVRTLLSEFPRYQAALLLGPDVQGRQAVHYLRDAALVAAPAPDAVVWQPWSSSEGGRRDRAYDFDLEREEVNRLLLGRAAGRKPLWISESGGEPTSQFGDAIRWAQRIQVAARLGADVIFRRPDLQEEPCPDFWVSLLHKRLCGRAVLDSRVSGGNVSVIAHCTAAPSASPRVAPHLVGSFASLSYERGDMTLLAVNRGASPARATLKLNPMAAMHHVMVHEYVLTSPDISSRITLLNGRPLALEDGGSLPVLSPKMRETGRDVVVAVPPHSVAFFVFPGAHARACQPAPDAATPEVEASPGARVVLGSTAGQEMQVRFDMDEVPQGPGHSKSKVKEKLAKEGNKPLKKPFGPKEHHIMKIGTQDRNISHENKASQRNLLEAPDTAGRRKRAVQEKPRKFSPEDLVEKIKKTQQAWKRKPLPTVPVFPTSQESLDCEGAVPVAAMYRPDEIKIPKPQIKPSPIINSMKLLLKKQGHPPHRHFIPQPPKPFKPIPSGAALEASLVDPKRGTSAEEETAPQNRQRKENPFPEGAVLIEVGESSEERASKEGVDYVTDDDDYENEDTNAAHSKDATVKNIPPKDLILDDAQESSPADKYYYGPGEYYHYLRQLPPERAKRPHSDSEFGETDLLVEPIDGHQQPEPPQPEPHFEDFVVEAATPPPREQEEEARSKAEQQVEQFYAAAAAAKKEEDSALNSAEAIDTDALVQLGKKYLQEHKMTLKEGSSDTAKTYNSEGSSGGLDQGENAVSQKDYGLDGKKLTQLEDDSVLQGFSERDGGGSTPAEKGSQGEGTGTNEGEAATLKRDKRDSPAAARNRGPRAPPRSRVPEFTRVDTPIASSSSSRIARLQNREDRRGPRPSAVMRPEPRSPTSRSLAERMASRTSRPGREGREESLRDRLDRARTRTKRSDLGTYRDLYQSFGSEDSPPPLEIGDDDLKALTKSGVSSGHRRYGEVPQERDEQLYNTYVRDSMTTDPKDEWGGSLESTDQQEKDSVVTAEKEDEASDGESHFVYESPSPNNVVSYTEEEGDEDREEQVPTMVQRHRKKQEGQKIRGMYWEHSKQKSKPHIIDVPEPFRVTSVRFLPPEKKDYSLFQGVTRQNKYSKSSTYQEPHQHSSTTFLPSKTFQQNTKINRHNNIFLGPTIRDYNNDKSHSIQPLESPKTIHQQLYHRAHSCNQGREKEEVTSPVQKECSGQGFRCYFDYFLTNPERADAVRREEIAGESSKQFEDERLFKIPEYLVTESQEDYEQELNDGKTEKNSDAYSNDLSSRDVTLKEEDALNFEPSRRYSSVLLKEPNEKLSIKPYDQPTSLKEQDVVATLDTSGYTNHQNSYNIPKSNNNKKVYRRPVSSPESYQYSRLTQEGTKPQHFTKYGHLQTPVQTGATRNSYGTSYGRILHGYNQPPSIEEESGLEYGIYSNGLEGIPNQGNADYTDFRTIGAKRHQGIRDKLSLPTTKSQQKSTEALTYIEPSVADVSNAAAGTDTDQRALYSSWSGPTTKFAPQTFSLPVQDGLGGEYQAYVPPQELKIPDFTRYFTTTPKQGSKFNLLTNLRGSQKSRGDYISPQKINPSYALRLEDGYKEAGPDSDVNAESPFSAERAAFSEPRRFITVPERKALKYASLAKPEAYDVEVEAPPAQSYPQESEASIQSRPHSLDARLQYAPVSPAAYEAPEIMSSSAEDEEATQQSNQQYAALSPATDTETLLPRMYLEVARTALQAARLYKDKYPQFATSPVITYEGMPQEEPAAGEYEYTPRQREGKNTFISPAVQQKYVAVAPTWQSVEKDASVESEPPNRTTKEDYEVAPIQYERKYVSAYPPDEIQYAQVPSIGVRHQYVSTETSRRNYASSRSPYEEEDKLAPRPISEGYATVDLPAEAPPSSRPSRPAANQYSSVGSVYNQGYEEDVGPSPNKYFSVGSAQVPSSGSEKNAFLGSVTGKYATSALPHPPPDVSSYFSGGHPSEVEYAEEAPLSDENYALVGPAPKQYSSVGEYEEASRPSLQGYSSIGSSQVSRSSSGKYASSGPVVGKYAAPPALPFYASVGPTTEVMSSKQPSSGDKNYIFVGAAPKQYGSADTSVEEGYEEVPVSNAQKNNFMGPTAQKKYIPIPQPMSMKKTDAQLEEYSPAGSSRRTYTPFYPLNEERYDIASRPVAREGVYLGSLNKVQYAKAPLLDTENYASPRKLDSNRYAEKMDYSELPLDEEKYDEQPNYGELKNDYQTQVLSAGTPYSRKFTYVPSGPAKYQYPVVDFAVEDNDQIKVQSAGAQRSAPTYKIEYKQMPFLGSEKHTFERPIGREYASVLPTAEEYNTVPGSDEKQKYTLKGPAIRKYAPVVSTAPKNYAGAEKLTSSGSSMKLGDNETPSLAEEKYGSAGAGGRAFEVQPKQGAEKYSSLDSDFEVEYGVPQPGAPFAPSDEVEYLQVPAGQYTGSPASSKVEYGAAPRRGQTYFSPEPLAPSVGPTSRGYVAGPPAARGYTGKQKLDSLDHSAEVEYEESPSSDAPGRTYSFVSKAADKLYPGAPRKQSTEKYASIGPASEEKGAQSGPREYASMGPAAEVEYLQVPRSGAEQFALERLAERKYSSVLPGAKEYDAAPRPRTGTFAAFSRSAESEYGKVPSSPGDAKYASFGPQDEVEFLGGPPAGWSSGAEKHTSLDHATEDEYRADSNSPRTVINSYKLQPAHTSKLRRGKRSTWTRDKQVMPERNELTADKINAFEAQQAPAASAGHPGEKEDVTNLVEETGSMKSLDNIQRLLGSLLNMTKWLRAAEPVSSTVSNSDTPTESIFEGLPWSLYRRSSRGNVPEYKSSDARSEPPSTTEMANLDWLQAREEKEKESDDIDDEEWSAETERMRRKRQEWKRRQAQGPHHQETPVPSFVTGIVTSMLGKVASIVGYLTNLTKFDKDST